MFGDVPFGALSFAGIDALQGVISTAARIGDPSVGAISGPSMAGATGGTAMTGSAS